MTSEGDHYFLRTLSIIESIFANSCLGSVGELGFPGKCLLLPWFLPETQQGDTAGDQALARERWTTMGFSLETHYKAAANGRLFSMARIASR